MHIKRLALGIMVICLLIAALASCNLPAPLARATPSPDYTHLYETISARLTQTLASTAQPATGTPAAPNPTGTQAPAGATNTPQPSPLPVTRTPEPPCNRAAAGNPIDITIPDDTIMRPSQSFAKTWRLINTGACTWSTRYAVVFFSGELFGAATVNYLPAEVNPGQIVDITIDMIAPSQAGSFQSNWKMADDNGQSFGIGPNGDAPIWVRIQIIEPQTATPEPTLTPSPSPTPAIIISGIIELVLDDNLDLDNLARNPDSGADILYQVDPERSLNLFIPQNGALLGIYGQNRPEYGDCENAIISADSIPVDVLPPDLYLCYRTNLGLPGWLRLITLPDSEGKVSIEALTWAIP